jgi:hypothetical protein
MNGVWRRIEEMNAIPPSEITFHPQSFGADKNGRLFEWQGHVYRAVTSRHATCYRDLFAKGVIQRLVDQGLLVGTEITSLQLAGYELVLSHDRVRFVSYPFEWCGRMLQDAALSFLSLSLELAKAGWTTQDANPWNMLFDGCKPVCVDFCSLVPQTPSDGWEPYDEFCRFFLYPLRLFASGHEMMVRWSLHDFRQGIPLAEFAAMYGGGRPRPRRRESLARLPRALIHTLPGALQARLRRPVRFLRAKLGHRGPSRIEFLERLQSEVGAIQILPRPSAWSTYYGVRFPSFSPSEDWTVKESAVFSTLARLRPKSTLDIGSNRGWYSQLAATLGSSVVGFDTDEGCVSLLHGDAQARHLSVTALVMDLTNPSPGQGLCNTWFPPATDRLRCEMVLALALTHHLVFKTALGFDQIAQALSAFSTRWLLVEFVPKDDEYVREWWSEDHGWYVLDSFRASLRKCFRQVEVMDSSPSPRKLLLCEK